MARKRDTWDKVNRPKKLWHPRRVANGPSPVGALLDRIREKSEGRKRRAKQQWAESIARLAKAKGRSFSICPALLPLLQAAGVDTTGLVNATKSALSCVPLQVSSMPVKFWLFNRKIEKLSKQARALGGQVEVHVIPERLLPWILKFKRNASLAASVR